MAQRSTGLFLFRREEPSPIPGAVIREALRSRCPRPYHRTSPSPAGVSTRFFPWTMKPPYMAQWSLSYQRQITPNWLASASYLGNKTTHVLSGQDINPARVHTGQHRQHELEEAAVLAESDAGSGLRPNHAVRSERQCQLQRPAAFDPAPVQPRVHMADQLHVVALPERRGSLPR